jgi:hypothetical protein
MASGKLLVSSISLGVALATTTLLLAWLSISYGYSQNFLKWTILPVLGYLYTFGLNAGLQTLACGSPQLASIALASLATPFFILIGLSLTLLGVVRAPIASAVPLKMRLNYGGIAALVFYMFWAGMFGEAYVGSTAQTCPTA